MPNTHAREGVRSPASVVAPPSESNSPSQSNSVCFESDFDTMRARKRKESTRKRSKRDICIINDNDDQIVELLQRMRDAAEEDRVLNGRGKPAVNKVALLKMAASQLRKRNLQLAFLEHNVLNVLCDWLAPMPNKALPCLLIRNTILKLLMNYPPIEKLQLKESGIGKAVMYLHKHPKETRENRERAGWLIFEWARHVHMVPTDFKKLSHEERQSLAVVKCGGQTRATSPSPAAESTMEAGNGGGKHRNSGHLVVPQCVLKEYTIRPKSNCNIDLSKVEKKEGTRYNAVMKRFTSYNRLQQSLSQRAVKVSIKE